MNHRVSRTPPQDLLQSLGLRPITSTQLAAAAVTNPRLVTPSAKKLVKPPGPVEPVNFESFPYPADESSLTKLESELAESCVGPTRRHRNKRVKLNLKKQCVNRIADKHKEKEGGSAENDCFVVVSNMRKDLADSALLRGGTITVKEVYAELDSMELSIKREMKNEELKKKKATEKLRAAPMGAAANKELDSIELAIKRNMKIDQVLKRRMLYSIDLAKKTGIENEELKKKLLDSENICAKGGMEIEELKDKLLDNMELAIKSCNENDRLKRKLEDIEQFIAAANASPSQNGQSRIKRTRSLTKRTERLIAAPKVAAAKVAAPKVAAPKVAAANPLSTNVSQNGQSRIKRTRSLTKRTERLIAAPKVAAAKVAAAKVAAPKVAAANPLSTNVSQNGQSRIKRTRSLTKIIEAAPSDSQRLQATIANDNPITVDTGDSRSCVVPECSSSDKVIYVVDLEGEQIVPIPYKGPPPTLAALAALPVVFTQRPKRGLPALLQHQLAKEAKEREKRKIMYEEEKREKERTQKINEIMEPYELWEPEPWVWKNGKEPIRKPEDQALIDYLRQRGPYQKPPQCEKQKSEKLIAVPKGAAANDIPHMSTNVPSQKSNKYMGPVGLGTILSESPSGDSGDLLLAAPTGAAATSLTSNKCTGPGELLGRRLSESSSGDSDDLAAPTSLMSIKYTGRGAVGSSLHLSESSSGDSDDLAAPTSLMSIKYTGRGAVGSSLHLSESSSEDDSDELASKLINNGSEKSSERQIDYLKVGKKPASQKPTTQIVFDALF